MVHIKDDDQPMAQRLIEFEKLIKAQPQLPHNICTYRTHTHAHALGKIVGNMGLRFGAGEEGTNWALSDKLPATIHVPFGKLE